jgi:putative spermidine/putrescine transport system substrate-binding protein
MTTHKAKPIGRRTLLGGALAAVAAPAVHAQAPSGEITFLGYTGIFEDNYKPAVVEPFMRRFPDIRVNYISGTNSAQILGTLRGQRAHPQVDVALLDVSIARAGNDEGLLARLDPAQVPNLGELFDLAKPPQEGFGPAVTFDHLTVIYDTRAVVPPPAALRDLWDGRFRGKLAIYAPPDINGLALTILVNHTLGADYKETIDGAIRRLAELAPNVQTWTPNPDSYTLILNGVVSAGTGWNARSQLFSDQSQGRLGVLLPQDGSAFQINTLNLVANAPNARAAQAFINYAIGAEAQKAFTERMFYGPVNRTAQIAPEALRRTAASPENMARMVPIDWAYVATVRDRWNERWRREVIR